jgi:hypothetical protein
MDEQELQTLITKIYALKTDEVSGEFSAGVDAAKEIIAAMIQEQKDRERMRKLEEELAALRTKYQTNELAVPKKRGRKPKAAL